MARLVRWQAFLAVLGILVVGGLLAQLSLTRQTVVIPIPGGAYTEGVVGSPQYLNPLLATTDADRSVVSLLFEGLSRLQPDGSVSPALAQSWAISADGMVYTCTLRSNARWHDGEPVTAEDVLFTLDVIRSPHFPDPNRLAELWSRVQVEALDSRRLRFTLERPYAPFLSYTTLPILPAHVLQDTPPADLPVSAYNLSPVGSGPFRFVEIREEEDGTLSLELQANPLYYETSPIYLEGIRIRFFAEENDLVEALLRGEVDGAFGLSPESLSRLKDRPDFTAYRTYLQAYTILFLNTQSPILADLRIRQAIAMGVNQEELIQGLEDQVFLANGPISPFSWAYKADLAPLRYDPAGAADLLEKAGWHDWDGDSTRERDVRALKLTLLTWNLPSERVTVAHRIEHQLAPLGISVRVIVQDDLDAFRRQVAQREYDLLLYGWGQIGRDPDEFALWHSSQIGPGGTNLSAFQNAEMDQLLEKGREFSDRDLRTLVYWQFQELFVKEIPAIPLYYPVYTYVVRTQIQGVELQPLNDLGDRFRSVGRWYIKTQKVIQGWSQPATPYRSGR